MTSKAWYICTDQLKDGGKVVSGPYSSRDDALRARIAYEEVNHPRTYWVDSKLIETIPTSDGLGGHGRPAVQSTPYEERNK